jgi:hypothetical protein
MGTGELAALVSPAFPAVGRVCAANSAALGGRPPGGVYSVERCFVALYETE